MSLRTSAVSQKPQPSTGSMGGEGDLRKMTVWDGEASNAGMWDGWLEGPSCSFIKDDASAITSEELGRLESLYKKARRIEQPPCP